MSPTYKEKFTESPLPSATRTQRLEMRLTEDEKALIERAAAHTGIDPASAVRQEALAWARWALGISPPERRR